MCGICGILGSPKRSEIDAMNAVMRHRGPDDSGVYIDGVVGFGMDRLAIIDVSQAGHQPMSTPDKDIWIVYNGEMYNFQEERDILIKKGCRFTSTSDTEVVLRMYEAYGDGFLTRMRAMFGLAIYDKRKGPGKERLLLARDNFGIKPLMYVRSGGSFVFASEMKSLLASGRVARAIDPEALRLLLTTGSVPQPHTIVKGVRMLLPGHRLIIENTAEKVERYWSLDAHRRDELKTMSYGEATSYLRSALEESVRLQMVSDVPLGAFLSGGVDSAISVALMSRHSSHKVRTFSVGFEAEGADIDETDDASIIARHIGTDHTRVLVTGKDMRDRILHIASALDQPSVDGANAYFVSMVARRAVTVAISGTGGDELFAGYPWFIDMLLAQHREKARNGCAGKIAGGIAGAARSGLFDFMLSIRGGGRIDLLRGRRGFLPQYARLHQIFGTLGAARVMARPLRGEARVGREPSLDLQKEECGSEGPVERVSGLCLRGYTQNQLLRDIDVVSMSHSLEVRVPFIDPVVVDVALSIPPEHKLGTAEQIKNAATRSYRDTGAKRILIDAAKDLLPRDIDLQAKRGFGMPFSSWLAGPLRDVLDDALSPASLKKRGIFDEREVRFVRDGFFRDPADWSRLWLLMITELWARQVLDAGESQGAAAHVS
jgi:asparagine synthase (glutamine-hydrolysing)